MTGTNDLARSKSGFRSRLLMGQTFEGNGLAMFLAFVAPVTAVWAPKQQCFRFLKVGALGFFVFFFIIRTG